MACFSELAPIRFIIEEKTCDLLKVVQKLHQKVTFSLSEILGGNNKA